MVERVVGDTTVNAKRLLVFPGSGNPVHTAYSGGYRLIADGARSAGFETREVVDWPGRIKQNGATVGELTFWRALDVAMKRFQTWNDHGLPFTLFARSFGTLIAAKVFSENIAPMVDRVILWGPRRIPSCGLCS